jgi:hypothetical protein
MGLLNRVSPLWDQVHGLPPGDRKSLATVIVGYDFCRTKVEKELVPPLRTVLGKMPAGMKPQLVDEALLGVLRSSAIPRRGRGVVPDHVARSLPDLLGTLACAAASHQAGQFRGHILEESGYSDDPAVARRQVLAVWGGLAGLSPHDIDAVDAAGFGDGWQGLTTSLLEGLLTGLSRAGSAMLFDQAEKVTRRQPPHLEIVIRGLGSNS